MALSVVHGLYVARHARHPLHAEDRIWVEKNCYVDLWIELLHTLELEPLACLSFTLAVDFEGDQWTFFKPSHDELRELYGIDVQELTVWRPLIEHAEEHLGQGKWISTEADAFWLPDTAGTDYRRQHTKTTIVLNELDVAHRRLGYFHNAGYYTLEGEDFDRTFRLGVPHDPAFLPLFAEVVRIDRQVSREPEDLRRRSWALLRKHLARRPSANPIVRFQQRFEQELPALQTAGLATYHRWAFATIRQLGAAFELAALHLDWLSAAEDAGLRTAREAFMQIAAANKALILKAARAVNSGKALDSAAAFAEMALAWDIGMQALSRSA